MNTLVLYQWFTSSKVVKTENFNSNGDMACHVEIGNNQDTFCILSPNTFVFFLRCRERWKTVPTPQCCALFKRYCSTWVQSYTNSEHHCISKYPCMPPDKILGYIENIINGRVIFTTTYTPITRIAVSNYQLLAWFFIFITWRCLLQYA